MYERHSQPPLSRGAFSKRLLKHSAVALLLLLGSLAAGMAGYMVFENFAPEDAFLHAASLLAGMGLAAPPASTFGKLFAGAYALYAGLVFFAAAGIVLAPILHRMLHVFHWDERGSGEKPLR